MRKECLNASAETASRQLSVPDAGSNVTRTKESINDDQRPRRPLACPPCQWPRCPASYTACLAGTSIVCLSCRPNSRRWRTARRHHPTATTPRRCCTTLDAARCTWPAARIASAPRRACCFRRKCRTNRQLGRRDRWRSPAYFRSRPLACSTWSTSRWRCPGEP